MNRKTILITVASVLSAVITTGVILLSEFVLEFCDVGGVRVPVYIWLWIFAVTIAANIICAVSGIKNISKNDGESGKKAKQLFYVAVAVLPYIVLIKYLTAVIETTVGFIGG